VGTADPGGQSREAREAWGTRPDGSGGGGADATSRGGKRGGGSGRGRRGWGQHIRGARETGKRASPPVPGEKGK
jgi:hypothetical protein